MLFYFRLLMLLAGTTAVCIKQNFQFYQKIDGCKSNKVLKHAAELLTITGRLLQISNLANLTVCSVKCTVKQV